MILLMASIIMYIETERQYNFINQLLQSVIVN